MRRILIMGALVFGAYYLYQSFAGSRAAPSADAPSSQQRPTGIDATPFGEEMTGPSGQSGQSDISGSWAYTLRMPDGQISGTLTLWGPPNEMQGMMSNVIRADDSETLANIRASGPNVSFQIPSREFGTITFNATVRGGAMEGTMNVSGRDPFSFRATQNTP